MTHLCINVFADDYRAHTSCISEVERYEKRAPKKNGKVPPQQLWMELIADSIAMAPTHLQSYIRTMSTLDNVPRKEKPFYNFTANSLNLKNKHGSAIVAEIWKHLSDFRRNQILATKQNKEIGESAEIPKPPVNPLSTSVTEIHTQAENLQSDSNKKEVQDDKNGSVSVKVDKKIVKKKMKLAFKNTNSKSLAMKTLRKLVKEHFNKDLQISVKQIIKETISQGKYFSRVGDTVTILDK